MTFILKIAPPHLFSLGVREGEAGLRVAAVLAEGAGVQVDA